MPLSESDAVKAVQFLRELGDRLSSVAEYLIRNGKHEEAQNVMTAAVLLDGRSAKRHTGLGMVLTYLNEKRIARAEFEAAIALNPEFSPALVFMGELCLEDGEVRKAAEYFERELAVEESNGLEGSLELIESLCRCYIGTGQREKARALIDREIMRHSLDEHFLHLRDRLRLR